MQQLRSALGATASHGGGATQPGNSRWRCHAFTPHQGTRVEGHGRDRSIGQLPVVGNGNGNCLSGTSVMPAPRRPCRLALAPASGFFNATSCPCPWSRPPASLPVHCKFATLAAPISSTCHSCLTLCFEFHGPVRVRPTLTHIGLDQTPAPAEFKDQCVSV